MVTVSADARWTTARVVSHSSLEDDEGEMRVDAFRVDLSVMESGGGSGHGCQGETGYGGGGKSYCKVGELVRLSLRVMNLSEGTRNLMLMMAKEEEVEEEMRLMPMVEEDVRRDIGRPLPPRRARSAPISPTGESTDDTPDIPHLGERRKTVGTDTTGPPPPPPPPVHNPVVVSEVPPLPPPTYPTPPNDDRGRGDRYYYKNRRSINTPVVSEVNGYTFGVLGLDGDDDGTVRYSRDHELLAVDTALLLGEVKGQNSIEAELRFVPLREGTLDVPNLRLYDNCTERWYDCVHSLQIVSVNGSGVDADVNADGNSGENKQ